jgi:hypothetical protein
VATVSLVDGVIEGASNTFRARLSLPNPGNGLPAGLRCKADLPGAEGTAASLPTSGANAPPKLNVPVATGLRVGSGL